MLDTKNIITDLNEVPREWVFENYLALPETLSGQDVRVRSPWNPKDTKPSLFVYFKKGRYRFKDFSTARQGDGVTLVKELLNLRTRGEAAHKIVTDYIVYISSDSVKHRPTEYRRTDYSISAFKVRPWNQYDKTFWTPGMINSNDLKRYGVKPLSEYTLTKTFPNGHVENIIIDHHITYGYFKQDGTLTKIYQPFSKKVKFIKVTDYIQGTEQLTFNVPYLVIIGSLKDLMSFNKLGFKQVECICPDSENVVIPKKLITEYKQRYKQICTLFDNDPAGVKSMKKYKKLYDIPGIKLELENDMFDNIREHGIVNTRIHLYPLLTKALTGKTKQL